MSSVILAGTQIFTKAELIIPTNRKAHYVQSKESTSQRRQDSFFARHSTNPGFSHTVEVCKNTTEQSTPAFPCGSPVRKWQILQVSEDRLYFIYDYYCYTKGSRRFSQRKLYLWHGDRTNSWRSQKPSDHKRSALARILLVILLKQSDALISGFFFSWQCCYLLWVFELYLGSFPRGNCPGQGMNVKKNIRCTNTIARD